MSTEEKKIKLVTVWIASDPIFAPDLSMLFMTNRYFLLFSDLLVCHIVFMIIN